MRWGQAVLNGDCRMLAIDDGFPGVFGRQPDPHLVGVSFPRLFRADAHDLLVRELAEVEARKLVRTTSGPVLSVLVRPAHR